MNFSYLHKKSSAKDAEGKRIFADYEYANRKIDDFLEAVKYHNKKCEVKFLQGNHDEWVERKIAYEPTFEGMIEVDTGLHLKKRGIDWYPYWTDHKQYITIGKAIFVHGLYVNNNHVKKMATTYFGHNVFYGHVHDMQCYTPIMLEVNKVVAQSLGCMCEYDQPYLMGSPTNWSQGFAEFDFYEDGRFDYVLRRIFDHQIRVDGSIYKP